MISFCTHFQFYDDYCIFEEFRSKKRYPPWWSYLQISKLSDSRGWRGFGSKWLYFRLVWNPLFAFLWLTRAKNVSINVFQLKIISFLLIFVEGFSWQVAVLLSSWAYGGSHYRVERERQPECSRWKLRYWAREEKQELWLKWAEKKKSSFPSLRLK